MMNLSLEDEWSSWASGRPRLFLSYASADEAVVANVCGFLRALGHEVTWDQDRPDGSGYHWPDIAGQIDRCDALLLFVSQSSMLSDEVWKEYLRALPIEDAKGFAHDHFPEWFGALAPWPQRSKKILPVMLEDKREINFGRFSNPFSMGSGVPQTRDRAEPHSTPSAAAWTAAKVLSPKVTKGLEDQQELAGKELLAALHDLVASPKDPQAFQTVVNALMRLELSQQGVVAPQGGQLDLERLMGRGHAHDGSDRIDTPLQQWPNFQAWKRLVEQCLRAQTTAPGDDPARMTALRELLPERLRPLLDGVVPPDTTQREQEGRPSGFYAIALSGYQDENSTQPTRLEYWLHSATRRRNDAHLTFLVGPGAVHARLADEQLVIDQSGLLDKACDLAESLLDEDPNSVAKEIGSFLSSLVEFKAENRPVVQGRSADVSMTELRGHLLLLSHRANQFFVTQHQIRETPIDSWMTWVRLSDPQVSELVKLIKATEAPLDAWIMDGASTGQESETLGRIALRRALKDLRLSVHEGKQLGAESVLWLADVFWHSLVHDLAEYPTPQELAIQVALLHDSSRERPPLTVTREAPGRSSYRQIWASRDLDRVGEVVTRALDLGFQSKSAARRSLFRQMALTLRQQYEVRREVDGGYGIDHMQPPPASLAVSASYDLELEAALATTGDGRFHVAFPVVEVPAVNDREPYSYADGGTWLWAIGTFHGPGPRDRFPGKALLRVDAPASGSLASIRRPVEWGRLLGTSAPRRRDPMVGSFADLQGPLVLKINGSPLISLPNRNAPVPSKKTPVPKGGLTRGGSTDPKVRLVLPLAMGDYDNMQFLLIDLVTNNQDQEEASRGSGSGLPGWVRTEIQRAERYWLGFGISERDWNARMQLFVHATRADVHAKIAAMFSEELAPRDSLLRSCGIQPVYGSIADLQSLLEQMHEGREEG